MMSPKAPDDLMGWGVTKGFLPHMSLKKTLAPLPTKVQDSRKVSEKKTEMWIIYKISLFILSVAAFNN